MNVSSTTVLTRKLKPPEALFLTTDDPRFLWLKYQTLIYFADCLKTIEVRPGLCIKINVHTVNIEQAYKVFDYAYSFICVG